jgi:hypothetical protein
LHINIPWAAIVRMALSAFKTASIYLFVAILCTCFGGEIVVVTGGVSQGWGNRAMAVRRCDLCYVVEKRSRRHALDVYVGTPCYEPLCYIWRDSFVFVLHAAVQVSILVARIRCALDWTPWSRVSILADGLVLVLSITFSCTAVVALHLWSGVCECTRVEWSVH